GIEEAAARRQARIDSGEETIVGVNKYRAEQREPLEILSIDNSAVRSTQIARLQQLKRTRDAAAVQKALAALTAGARGGSNLLALTVDPARAGATVGEVSGALQAAVARPRAAL